jgi:hypothetical protein
MLKIHFSYFVAHAKFYYIRIAEENQAVNDFSPKCRVANKVGILRAIKTGIVGDTQNVRKDGFFALELAPAGHAGPPTRRDCRLPGFWRRSGCLPAEPYLPLKRDKLHAKACKRQQKLSIKAHFSNFDRTDLSNFDRTTTHFPCNRECDNA